MKFLVPVAIVLLSLILGLLSDGQTGIDQKTKLKLKLKKPDIIDIVFVGYNNWSYVMRNNGSVMYDLPDANGDRNHAGGEFPRGTGTTIVFAAGAWIGAIKEGIPVVSETQFGTEFQPGRITNSGVHFNFLKAENPDTSTNKVYVIDQTRSGSDYDNWPTDALRDAGGNPALVADAQTWAVFNDLDIELSQEEEWDSPNPGLGVQITLESFAFKNSFWSDVVLLKYTIENKTNENYGGCYFGSWADGDVDNASNDIIGSDSIRGMSYIYNIDNNDKPACYGVDFLQGPIVSSTFVHPLFGVKFSLQKYKLTYDRSQNRFFRVSMSGSLISLSATSSNPYHGNLDPINNSDRYQVLQGIFHGQPPLSIANKWAFPGNPVTRMGLLHSAPGDQRSFLSTGPFQLIPGEPQEIWVAVIGAYGTDRLQAVQKLFNTDDMIQKSFDAGLVMPEKPLIPTLSAIGHDGKIVLTWLNNVEQAEDIFGEVLGITTNNGFSENYVKNDFQGYRVYRSLTGLEGSFELLAQYDKIDSLGEVREILLEPDGTFRTVKHNFGQNTGLGYEFIDSNLVNGRKYYYSVTAYDAQPYITRPDSVIVTSLNVRIATPSDIPISSESSVMANVYSVVPQRPKAESKTDLKKILVVPNPFYGYSDYGRNVKFTGLPPRCTIKIFTVAGDLVRTLHHTDDSNNDRVSPVDPSIEAMDQFTSHELWDLTTETGRPAASGVYIALIESSKGQVKVKFAVIR